MLSFKGDQVSKSNSDSLRVHLVIVLCPRSERILDVHPYRLLVTSECVFVKLEGVVRLVKQAVELVIGHRKRSQIDDTVGL